MRRARLRASDRRFRKAVNKAKRDWFGHRITELEKLEFKNSKEFWNKITLLTSKRNVSDTLQLLKSSDGTVHDNPDTIAAYMKSRWEEVGSDTIPPGATYNQGKRLLAEDRVRQLRNSTLYIVNRQHSLAPFT